MGIGEQLEQALESVSVKRSELEIADTALARAKFDSFEPKLVHNKMEGVYEANLEKVGEIVTMELNLTDDLNYEQKIGKEVSFFFGSFLSGCKALCLTAMQFNIPDLVPAEGQRRYRSIYGAMFGMKNDDGNFDIAYAIYQLQFRLADDPNLEFTSGELEAINKTYMDHQALLAFKKENIIKEISYV